MQSKQEQFKNFGSLNQNVVVPRSLLNFQDHQTSLKEELQIQKIFPPPGKKSLAGLIGIQSNEGSAFKLPTYDSSFKNATLYQAKTS